MNRTLGFSDASKESKAAARKIMAITLGLIAFGVAPALFICGLLVAAISFMVINYRQPKEATSENPKVREGRLAELKDLFESGLISEASYDKRCSDILKGI